MTKSSNQFTSQPITHCFYLDLFRLRDALMLELHDIFFRSGQCCFTIYDIMEIQDSNTFIHQNYKIFNMGWYIGILIEIIVELGIHAYLFTGMEILIKAWSRCHKDHHIGKRNNNGHAIRAISLFFIQVLTMCYLLLSIKLAR